MATWCLCPIPSSVLNTLGLYDGLSASFDYLVTWGLPYLIGRTFFTRFEHLREMSIHILIGGIIYVPLCLWEVRMSPQLHLTVYGFDSGWGEVVYGGYRPKVFMSTGLELGLWMAATATTGIWLWGSGGLKSFGCAFPMVLVPAHFYSRALQSDRFMDYYVFRRFNFLHY